MNEAVESLTSNPKRLALVVAGGVALGLGWRYWNKRRNPAAYSSSADPGSGVDLNTGLPTVGAGAGSSSSDGDRRDTVSDSTLLLPVVNKVVKIGDKLFMTDGTTLTEINPVGGANDNTDSGNGTGDVVMMPGNTQDDMNAIMQNIPANQGGSKSIDLGNGLWQVYTPNGLVITDHP